MEYGFCKIGKLGSVHAKELNGTSWEFVKKGNIKMPDEMKGNFNFEGVARAINAYNSRVEAHEKRHFVG